MESGLIRPSFEQWFSDKFTMQRGSDGVVFVDYQGPIKRKYFKTERLLFYWVVSPANQTDRSVIDPCSLCSRACGFMTCCVSTHTEKIKLHVEASDVAHYSERWRVCKSSVFACLTRYRWRETQGGSCALPKEEWCSAEPKSERFRIHFHPMSWTDEERERGEM